jgi:hypothetical protein
MSPTYKNAPKQLNNVALGWCNAVSSLMHEFRQFENETWSQNHDHERTRPSKVEMQLPTNHESSHVHFSYQQRNHLDHDDTPSPARSPRWFVFNKLIKIRNVTSPKQVDIAVACVIFNAALINHFASRKVRPPTKQDADSGQPNGWTRLSEAAHLYRCVLRILQRKKAHSIHKGPARTLYIVALNNYAAVLTAMGPDYRSKAVEAYRGLFHNLSNFHGRQTSPMYLSESDVNSMYNACLSIVLQVDCAETAPAA